MTAQTNKIVNTSQQGIAEDLALSPERAAKRVEVLDKAQRVGVVMGELSRFTSACRNEFLLAATDALVASTEEILAVNARDIETGKACSFSGSLLNRLRLDATRVGGIASGLRQVAALPDSVDKVLRGGTLLDGIKLSQVSVPLGVMGMVYKVCPNVIVDTLGLALKSDNAVLLCGSEPAVHSNTQLVIVSREVLANHNAPGGLVQPLPCGTHGSVQGLITTRGLIDMMTPRGGADLIEAVMTKVAMPTIETDTGNRHIYIDASADIDEAIALMTDGKTRCSSVYNATEAVLIDLVLSAQDQVRISDALADVDVVVCSDAGSLAAPGWTGKVIPATAEGWSDGYLSLDTAAHIAGGVVVATDHIIECSSDHTETISVRDWDVCQKFVSRVDATAVNVNASAAFTDGEQCGFGAEVDISIQRLHARGPMGLPGLTNNKWVLAGREQTRPQYPGRVSYIVKRKRSVWSRVHAVLTSKSTGAPRQRTGVMGDTFDPIHNGHPVIINEVADRFDLDFVFFVSTDEP